MELYVIGAGNYKSLTKKQVANYLDDGRLEAKSLSFVENLFEEKNVQPIVFDAWGATFRVKLNDPQTDKEQVEEEISSAIEKLLYENQELLKSDYHGDIMKAIDELVPSGFVYSIGDISWNQSIGGYHSKKGLSQLSIILNDVQKTRGERQIDLTRDDEPNKSSKPKIDESSKNQSSFNRQSHERMFNEQMMAESERIEKERRERRKKESQDDDMQPEM